MVVAVLHQQWRGESADGSCKDLMASEHSSSLEI